MLTKFKLDIDFLMKQHLKKHSFIFILLILFEILALLHMPDALARAGRGASFGSRGSRTWSAPRRTTITPHWYHPVERTTTKPNKSQSESDSSEGSSSTSSGSYSSYYNTSRERSYYEEDEVPNRSSSTYYSRTAVPVSPTPAPVIAPRISSPIVHQSALSGFVGGLLGAGLFGLLTGKGIFGGFTDFLSFIGFLLQLYVIAFIIKLIARCWKKRVRKNSRYRGATVKQRNIAVTLMANDYLTFQSLLSKIQAAWSAQNIKAIRAMTTPEMAHYFGEQLSDLAGRDESNVVSNVQFLAGDLSEAWREGNLTYATVAMRYSLIDVTTDRFGNVTDGSPTEPQIVTELWTFVRADGRNWVLSAIQQAG